MAEPNCSIAKLFDKCEDFVLSLEKIASSDKTVQAQIRQTIVCLQDLSHEIGALGLFSSNEELSEVQTESLKLLLVPCFLGYLISLYEEAQEDRLKALEVAEEHFTEYLSQAKNYSFYSASPPTSEARDAKIRRHKEKIALSDRIQFIKKQKEEKDIDEDLLRELYTTQLKWWCYEAEFYIESLKREKPLLEHMVKLKINKKNEEPVQIEPVSKPKQKLKPVILTRNELQKQVFGMGYPSLPTMTVEEWYDKMSASGNVPIQNGGSNTEDPNKKDEEKDSAEDRNDETIVVKARAWDEYKDDHRKGWGNTFNKG